MQIEETHTAITEALNIIDNFEACNKLTEKQLTYWKHAREKLLEAAGAMVACEMAAR